MHQSPPSIGQPDKQKESAGVAAVFLWLGIGLMVFATHDNASLLSWQAVVFFVGGTLAAALVFGLPAYAIHRGITRLLVPQASAPTAVRVGLRRAIGVVVLSLQAIAVYVVANWVVADLLFTPARQ